ncbi:MAG: preprotein translocase subunit SecE [Candidatus Margulisiibacteriota bacterium]
MNNFKSIFDAIKKYLKETEVEARKVVWPGRKYVTAATVIILIIVVLSAVFITAVDFSFAKIFKFLIENLNIRL